MSIRKSFWEHFWVEKLYFLAAGILPTGGPSSMWKSILIEYLALSPLLYGLYVVIPEMKFILFLEHAVDDLLEAVIVVIIIFGAGIRILLVVVNRRKIVRMLSFCGTLWDHAGPADRRVVSVWIYRARLFSGTYFIAAQLAITLFVLNSSVRQFSSPINSTVKYYPFKFQDDCISSSEYEIKLTLQILIGYIGTSDFVAADMVGTLLTLNMCGQLALIKNWLIRAARKSSRMTERGTDASVKAELKKCIRRHQIVLNFCAELEELVQYINLAQIITGMFVIAIAGARLSKSLESYRYFGPLLSSICALFFSCWPAANLSSTSSEIAVAAYEIPWYQYPLSEKNAIMFMLARSQRSADLTAGKYVALSLQTFTSIVSNALSFCMILRSL